MEDVNREIGQEYKIREAIDILNEAIEKLSKILDEPLEKTTRPVSSEFIIDGVCDYFHIDKETLMACKRDRKLVEKRQLTATILHQHTNLTLREIAELLGYRNHSTIIHHVKNMSNYILGEYYGYDDLKKTYRQLLIHLKL